VTQGRSQKQQVRAKKWTRLLIDAALECGGRYYLPYQLYATEEQFNQTYPEFKILLERKKTYDPQGIFSNKFYEPTAHASGDKKN
jgi:FAD/FMN-containing dehydrogenase